MNMYDKSDMLVTKGDCVMDVRDEKKQAFTDPATGIVLEPSFHGENCLGNGTHEKYECCCDECAYYLECFPDWREWSK